MGVQYLIEISGKFLYNVNDPLLIILSLKFPITWIRKTSKIEIWKKNILALFLTSVYKWKKHKWRHIHKCVYSVSAGPEIQTGMLVLQQCCAERTVKDFTELWVCAKGEKKQKQNKTCVCIWLFGFCPFFVKWNWTSAYNEWSVLC